jgi:hypothetical protein
MGSSLMKLSLLHFILFLILFVTRIVTLITHINPYPANVENMVSS